MTPIDSPAAFLVALQRWHLLEPDLLQELACQPEGGEVEALAGELVRRSWLTPFQVNRLLQGRGEEHVLGP
jgi:hypothetical protein